MNEATAGSARIGVVDHVAIAVVDADQAAAAFATMLGLRVVGDEQVEAAGVRLIYLAPAEPDADDAAVAPTTIQLVQPLRPGKAADFIADHGEGLHHVCFQTSDIAASLRQAGVPEPAAAIFTGGRGRPCAFLIEQPHGALIELTEISTTS